MNFTAPTQQTPIIKPKSPVSSKEISPKYKSLLSNENINSTHITEKHKINDLLDYEKQKNKLDSWNKLDKMTKILKLHAYAERYGQEHKLTTQEIANLKEYLVHCINQSKLQKSKDVLFDKSTMEIQDISSLYFVPSTRHFTLRSQDAKRINTLKSLTVGKSASAKQASGKDSVTL